MGDLKPPQFFLGLDTGYARLGYGIIQSTEKNNLPEIVEHGVIETQKNQSDTQRLLFIEDFLNQILNKIKIHACALEEVFIRKNLSTGVRLLQSRGVTLLVLGKHDVPVHSISPTAAKKTLTGSGSAGKRQMQNMIVKLLHLKSMPKPDDAADAIALSLCAWLRHKKASIT